MYNWIILTWIVAYFSFSLKVVSYLVLCVLFGLSPYLYVASWFHKLCLITISRLCITSFCKDLILCIKLVTFGSKWAANLIFFWRWFELFVEFLILGVTNAALEYNNSENNWWKLFRDFWNTFCVVSTVLSRSLLYLIGALIPSFDFIHSISGSTARCRPI